MIEYHLSLQSKALTKRKYSQLHIWPRTPSRCVGAEKTDQTLGSWSRTRSLLMHSPGGNRAVSLCSALHEQKQSQTFYPQIPFSSQNRCVLNTRQTNIGRRNYLEDGDAYVSGTICARARDRPQRPVLAKCFCFVFPSLHPPSWSFGFSPSPPTRFYANAQSDIRAIVSGGPRPSLFFTQRVAFLVVLVLFSTGLEGFALAVKSFLSEATIVQSCRH